MSEITGNNKKWMIRALFVLPVCYLLLGIHFRNAVGDYFTWTADPEYAYLFNGLNVAQPSLKVWHTDHPGTPLQLLAALIINITYFFHGGPSLNESVCQDPELYLGIINLVLVAISSGILLWLGRIVYRGSGKLLPALFIQTTPFLSPQVFHGMMRVSIEQMLIISVLLLLCVILHFIYNEGERKGYVIAFAAVIGLGIASKITFASAFFLPLLLLPGWRKKVAYVILTGISFFIFILPVLIYRFEYFIGWVKALFFHSGQHGHGAEEIVNKELFWQNIHAIFAEDVFYTVVLIVSGIGILLYQMPKIKNNVRNKYAYYALIGGFVAIVFNILMVAKHYSYHYLLTSILFLGLQVYLVGLIYLKSVNRRMVGIVCSLATVIFLGYKYTQAVSIADNLRGRQAEYHKAVNFTKGLCGGDKMLIIPDFFNCAFKDFAINFGLYWSGDHFQKEYREALAKVLPNTYLYFGGDKHFYAWSGENGTISDLSGRYGRTYLYSIKPDLTAGLPEFDSTSNAFKNCSIRKVFDNPATNESIFEVTPTGLQQK